LEAPLVQNAAGRTIRTGLERHGWHSGCMRRDMDQRSGLDFVVERSALDRDFRLRLLADPKAAIRDAFGVELPQDFRLRFIERDRDVDLLIVLPDVVDDDVVEGDDLRGVSGAASSWLFDTEFRRP
jgi:hypothetical protein